MYYLLKRFRGSKSTDARVLEQQFHLYLQMCAHYRHMMTLGDFYSFSGWKFGELTDRRVKNVKLNQFLKDISELEKTELINDVKKNSTVGSIYLLKALYGLYDTSGTLQIETGANRQIQSAEDILAELGVD